MIKNVIFDMGGVMIDLDRDLCIGNFKQKAGFDRIEEFLDMYHQKGLIGEMEEGLIDEREFYRKCAEFCSPGTTEETMEFCLQSLLTNLNMSLIEQIPPLVGKYGLYILSNNNPICARAFLRKLHEANGIEQVFRKKYFSYEMKMLKPDRRIYETVIDELGCRPDEILFIDDSEINTRGAEAVGIRTVLYKKGFVVEDVLKTV